MKTDEGKLSLLWKYNLNSLNPLIILITYMVINYLYSNSYANIVVDDQQ